MQVMPKKPRRNKRFWETAYKLTSRFPAAFPVEIRVVKKIKGAWGYCEKKGGKFILTILEVRSFDEAFNYNVMVDIFIHEHAHALNWSHMHDRLEHAAWHDENWGVWYSRLYRSFTKDR